MHGADDVTKVWYGRDISQVPEIALSSEALDSRVISTCTGPGSGLEYIRAREQENSKDNNENDREEEDKTLIAGIANWNQNSCETYGISLSLYAQDPISLKIAGDPMADAFAVCSRMDSSIIIIADGVNWGEKSMLAARSAVYASMDFLQARLYGSGSQRLLHAKDAVATLRESFDVAHSQILRQGGGLTTLTAALVLPLPSESVLCDPIVHHHRTPQGDLSTSVLEDGDRPPDAPLHNVQNINCLYHHNTTVECESSSSRTSHAHQFPIQDASRNCQSPGNCPSSRAALCVLSLGDSLAFVLSQNHGVREVTVGTRDLAKVRDVRDAGGALGPVNGTDPALYNLSWAVTEVEKGDFVFLTTDGVTDNFDPVVTKVAVEETYSDLRNTCEQVMEASSAPGKNSSRDSTNSETSNDTGVITEGFITADTGCPQPVNTEAENIIASPLKTSAAETMCLEVGGTRVDNLNLLRRRLSVDAPPISSPESCSLLSLSSSYNSLSHTSSLSSSLSKSSSLPSCRSLSEQSSLQYMCQSRALYDASRWYGSYRLLSVSSATLTSSRPDDRINGNSPYEMSRSMVIPSSHSVDALRERMPLSFRSNNINHQKNLNKCDGMVGDMLVCKGLPTLVSRSATGSLSPSAIIKPPMTALERHQLMVKELERAFHEFEFDTQQPVSAREVCYALAKQAIVITTRKRGVMENREYQRVKKRDRPKIDKEIRARLSMCPGKLDHATIVACEVGPSPAIEKGGSNADTPPKWASPMADGVQWSGGGRSNRSDGAGKNKNSEKTVWRSRVGASVEVNKTKSEHVKFGKGCMSVTFPSFFKRGKLHYHRRRSDGVTGCENVEMYSDHSEPPLELAEHLARRGVAAP